MKTKPCRSWDQPMFELLTRVIDAVAYGLKPGVKTMLVAEYLARTSRAEVEALMRRKRNPSQKPRRTHA